MTDPAIAERKRQLRTELRRKRKEHAATLPSEVSALVFSRPPQQVLELVPAEATIGLYRSDEGEAPSRGYIRFFFERGHPIALPRVTTLDKPMEFRRHTDPYEESDLEAGVWGLRQPRTDAPVVVPRFSSCRWSASRRKATGSARAAATTTVTSPHIPRSSPSAWPGTCRKSPSCPPSCTTCASARSSRPHGCSARSDARQADAADTIRHPHAAGRPRRLRAGRRVGLAMDRAATGAGPGRRLSRARCRLAAAASPIPHLDGDRPLGLKRACHCPLSRQPVPRWEELNP